MRWYSAAGLIICFVATLLSGCSSENVDVVDLNKVLDAVASVLAESDKSGASESATVNVTAENATAEVDSQAMMVEAIDPTKQDAEKEKEFLTKLAAKMNELKVMNAQVGVSMTASGEIMDSWTPMATMFRMGRNERVFGYHRRCE